MAKQKPIQLTQHGEVRIDPYYWLRERENPEVMAYLEAENRRTEQTLAHTARLQEDLYQEIVGRIKKTDESVPYRLRDYLYYVRHEGEGEYPIICRRKPDGGAEEVLLNVNELAGDQAFYSVAETEVSSGQDLLAFAFDNVGRRIYTLRFRNLRTGEFLDDEIPDVTGNIAWAEDNVTLFYAKHDPETLRSFRIYRHRIGTDPANDALVFEETDDTFSCYVSKTKSRKYVVIHSVHTLSAEARYIDAKSPEGEFTIFLPRRRDHEYEIDHHGDAFFVLTNDKARNFRLMKTSEEDRALEHWEEVIPHCDTVLIEGFQLFRDHLVVEERIKGLMQIRIRPWSGEEEHYIDFGEAAYTAFVMENYEIDTGVLRFGYTSLTTPRSTYDYDMKKRRKTLLKRQEVLGGFDQANYLTERLYAPARDGEKVPISLVYRRGVHRDGKRPLLLYGYGAYGLSLDAAFRSDRLSLLDRGFTFAIAHVRGGEELGRRWYEEGRLLKKRNTFNDFIDCAEHLQREKYADPERTFAMGGSAGGLLVGAVINMRPDLFKGVVAAVPFVDVLTTMLDDSIPLTTGEYDEWGNPNEKRYYDYIRSYSPYDNLVSREYPHILVTTSLHDSQVQYWEPAKWVAKLRAIGNGKNRLLLKTDLEAGHGGASGRFKSHRETALNYAFLLDLSRDCE